MHGGPPLGRPLTCPTNKPEKSLREYFLMGADNQLNQNGRLRRKQYEKEIGKLQAELCKLQDWVRHKGLRVIVVFEGRDAAGKGGTIRAITERVSPRVFRVVALPAPSN